MTTVAKITTAITEFNRRSMSRHDVTLLAKIGFRDLPPISCTVRNISPMGALLEFGGDIALPETFRIVIETKMFWADCEVRHHKGKTAGVMFISNRMEALAAFG